MSDRAPLLVGFAESEPLLTTVAALVGERRIPIAIPYHHRVDVERLGTPAMVLADPLSLPAGATFAASRNDLEQLLYMCARARPAAPIYELVPMANAALSYAEHFLDEQRPSRLIFSDVPHHAVTWALHTRATARGIPSFFIREGPTTHHYWVNSDVAAPRVRVIEARGGERSRVHDEVTAWLDKLSGSYAAAMPGFMRKAKLATTVSALARTLRKGPTTTARRAAARVRWELERARMQAALAAAGAARSGRAKAVFYLHFQPERTTSPEAGPFADQLAAIAMLRAGLPRDIDVVVREHPAVFKYIRDSSVVFRGKRFYDAIAAIDGVSFSDTADSFVELEAALLVATCTGTIGTEALVRGRPVLYFGDAPFSGAPGAYPVTCSEDVASAVASIVTPDRDSYYRYVCGAEAAGAIVVPSGKRTDALCELVRRHALGVDDRGVTT